MEKLLYLVAVILVILWLIGFVGYDYGGNLIHSLLVIAFIVIILRVIRGKKLL
jgi:hypothetical protein